MLKKKNEKIVLTELQVASFEKLKMAMCTTPVLALPDFSKSFGIRMDACDYAIGGVLFQLDRSGVEHPIAYGGRKLSKSELHYSVREKELLAIIYAMRLWRPYLLDQPFVVETDHQTLQELLTQSTCTQRLARWLDFLSEYRPEFKWIPGNTNTTADGISRRHDLMTKNRPASKVDLPGLLRQILARIEDPVDEIISSDDTLWQSMYFANFDYAMMVFQLLQADDISELCKRYYKTDALFGPVWTSLKGGQEDSNECYPDYSLHNDLLWYSKGDEEKCLYGFAYNISSQLF